MSTNKTRALFSAAVLMSPVVEAGGYLGIGIGQAEYSSNITSGWDDSIRKQFGIDPVINTFGTTSDQDDSTLGFKLYGGYDFNRYFALEGFYVDLGELDLETSWSGIGQVGQAGQGNRDIFTGTTQGSGKIEPQALGVSAIGKLPVTDWFRVYAKLGTYYYRSQLEGNASVNGTLAGGGSYNNSAPQDEIATGFSWLYGIGVGFTVAKHIGLNLEWESYQDLEIDYTNGGNDSYDVGLISASIDYKF